MYGLIGRKRRIVATLSIIVLCTASVAGLVYGTEQTTDDGYTVRVQKGTTVEKTLLIRNDQDHRLKGELTVANAACGNRCPHMDVISQNDVDIPRGGLLFIQVRISSHIENDCGECSLTIYCVEIQDYAAPWDTDAVEVLDVNIIIQEGEVEETDDRIMVSIIPKILCGIVIGTIFIFICYEVRRTQNDLSDSTVAYDEDANTSKKAGI